jgi:hypothetical protein
MHAGQATYYAADGSGNCSFDAAPGDPLVAAMNDADYAACGGVWRVRGDRRARRTIDGSRSSIAVRSARRATSTFSEARSR